MSTNPPTAPLAPTSVDDRARARALRAEIDAGRDRIAQLDLEIEDRLALVARFDATLHRQLRAERRDLDRVLALARMLERWTVALEERAAHRVPQAGVDIEARRARELYERREREAVEDQAEAEVEGAGATEDQVRTSPDDAPSAPAELKSAYRQLARCYHPDLARTEEDRIEFGRVMARINAAYHDGDLGRLLALVETAAAIVEDLDELAGKALAERVEALTRERGEVARVLEDLEHRRARIDESPSHRLWLRWQEAVDAGDDFFATMRGQLRDRTQDAQAGIGAAVAGLEAAVKRHNRRHPTDRAGLARDEIGDLAKTFDPEAGRQLARLLLDEGDIDRTDPRVTDQADRIEAWAVDAPARLRLLLLAYVAQLSDRPLPGLERQEDYVLRFDHLGAEDPEPVDMTQAMAELADVLEFGVLRADSDKVRTGFRFRSQAVLSAIPLALLRVGVRRELRRLLKVLGEATSCSECGAQVFLMPVFRSTGFDSLRAVVCPACGHTHQRYWLPKGDDVQALLNQAYLELEIVTEWTFELGGEHGATQLLPVEVDSMTLGDLKQRIVTDLFERYDIGVRRGQLRLLQGGARVPEKSPLASLEDRRFTLAFGKGLDFDEADAAQRLHHRIRHRFD